MSDSESGDEMGAKGQPKTPRAASQPKTPRAASQPKRVANQRAASQRAMRAPVTRTAQPTRAVRRAKAPVNVPKTPRAANAPIGQSFANAFSRRGGYRFHVPQFVHKYVHTPKRASHDESVAALHAILDRVDEALENGTPVPLAEFAAAVMAVVSVVAEQN
jgi:hypothetical protein